MNIMTKSKTAAEAVPEILGIYGASLLAGDADRWISLWTEDGVQMPPRGPMRIGKQTMYEGVSADFNAHTYSDFEMVGDLEIQEMGDWAYSIAQGSYTKTPKDGSRPDIVEVKALSIYQRQPDGEWKMHRDCFNWNVPHP
jgi:uncharacterized protein (TIGR02246 family)